MSTLGQVHAPSPSHQNVPVNDDATRPWTIAEVAAEFGVTHRTVRFYEDQGLISPERRGTARMFHPRDRVRLALVLRGKRLGFDLGQIRRIVDMYGQAPGEAGQLRYLLEQIADRRADLEQRRRDIEVTLTELDDVERRCRATLARLGGGNSKGPAADS
ncbi:MAG TPA: MerR family DNA-binding transcriptional regulator [Kineosporiaceae bacterium]|nr:MerR family DNA-binding transcriptional regulator [Kineosporiaceae bacterium]